MTKNNGKTVFAVLPYGLRKPVEHGCGCAFCKAHPGQLPKWDTLAFDAKNPQRTWTVHYPEFAQGNG